MPGLVRKLLIFAAVDGLILQPAPPRAHKPTTDQAIKIAYKSVNGQGISPLLKDRRQDDTAKETLEAHGIIGLLKVASSSFLVSISRRDQVALIRGKPVYCISEVALIPLSSQSDAEQAITRAKLSQQRHSKINEDSLVDSSDEEDNISLPEDASLVSHEMEDKVEQGKERLADFKQKTTTVADDIINKKGVYGRFTDRWFSKKGWTADSRRTAGLSSEEDLKKITSPTRNITLDVESADKPISEEQIKAQASISGPLEATQVAPAEVAHVMEPSSEPRIALLPKILTTTKIFFSSKNFFFSYDYDLSRSVANQVSTSSSQPLSKMVDPMFFWNHHLIEPFMESGQYGYALPLIQGFVGQREFTVDMSSKSSQTITDVISDPKDMDCAKNEDATPEPSDSALPQPPKETSNASESKKFLLTLISRRSIDRAGLRYLRRGVDEEGHVANSVETEQILSPPTWDPSEASDTLYSFVQYRGSIPLFFSQSPYSLKPIVMLHGSSDANTAAFKLHFQHLKQRYGNVQVASLVEKKGNEARVGDLYQEQANKIINSRDIDSKEPDVRFEWFDFHAMCKGMRFENVSLLFDTLKPTLRSYGWTEKTGADRTRQRQSGILRTNCMDCLDRTNVVQSACGGLVLQQQLAQQGITIDLQKDPSTSWFNTLWADNGDSISRQYAGTAALKGDFTRTRHRNISGALTDFGLTLSRYYNNIVNDYFAQAVIDFLLGRADENIFIDFEADMGSKDYAIDLRKVRQNAIDTCVNICIENPDEHLVAAWTLRTPPRSGAVKSHAFEECILLLTEAAVYCCRMDWSTEKVRAFEKVELECVEGLTRGTYITSTLAKRDIDETKNVGFVLTYNTKGKDLVRTNTRSLTSVEEESDEAGKTEGAAGPEKKPDDAVELFAFKALPPKSSFVGSKNRDEEPPSEAELTKLICDQIARQVNSVRAATEGQQSPVEPQTGGVLMVEEKDVVSLAEARKSTGYLETLGYSLKKLVWAS